MSCIERIPIVFYTHYNSEKHRNDIEIDFVISNGSKLKPKIYPSEVKSGKKYSITSLERFMDKFSSRIVIDAFEKYLNDLDTFLCC